MKLATSCVLASYRPDGRQLSVEKSLELLSQAGFCFFDINFWDWSRPSCNSPFLSENWRSWAEHIAEYSCKLNVQIGQGHAYTYSFLDPLMTDEERNFHESLTRCSIECCRIMGVKTCVIHPDTDWHTVKKFESSRQKNIEYIKPLLEYTLNQNMELAVENMFNSDLSHIKYCSTSEELTDLVSSFKDDRIGICWDFEHGVIMDADQPKELCAIGNMLKATHVSDTYSKTDTSLMHVHPLFGDLKWENIVHTLNTMNYQNYFSYEISRFSERLPDVVLPTALKLSYEIGKYLMELGDEHENRH